MAYFPLFVELSGRKVLIVGGGGVAMTKAENLIPYGPEITVVAPEITPELLAIPGIAFHRRSFSENDLSEELAFVLAATNDPEENRRITSLCKEKHIPVNVADNVPACDFIFPAVIQRGRLTIGITTSGASPTAAAWLRRKIEALLPEHLEEIFDYLEAMRPHVKARFPHQKTRAKIFRAMFHKCMETGGPLTDQQYEDILEELDISC